MKVWFISKVKYIGNFGLFVKYLFKLVCNCLVIFLFKCLFIILGVFEFKLFIVDFYWREVFDWGWGLWDDDCVVCVRGLRGGWWWGW